MIKRINIANFGSYKDFVWAAEMRDAHGNVTEFKRLNIIYGRNYSGKTTLSRLVRSMETAVLPVRYDAPRFEIVTSSGSLDQAQIGAHGYHVRVFNKDFVDANLSFLRDDGGHITPFAIVGLENNDVQTQIDDRQQRLGTPDSNGLRHNHAQKVLVRQQKSNDLAQASSDKNAQLTRKANQDIKRNRLYGHATYNVNRICEDIDWIRTHQFQVFDDTEVLRHTNILQLNALAPLNSVEDLVCGFQTIAEEANQVLTRIIRPTEPIQELLNDALLQSWVKSGISHHRDKRTSCGFCGADIPADLWRRIDAHFSQESEELDSDIDSCLSEIKSASEAANQVPVPVVSGFYPDLKPEAERLTKQLSDSINALKVELDGVAAALQARKENVFTAISAIEVSDCEAQVNLSISRINELIYRHNQQVENLGADKDASMLALRRNAVARFIADIDLAGMEARIEALQAEEQTLRVEEESLFEQVQTVESELAALQLQLRDERKGAEKVNEYLSHHFGHSSLRLVAVDGDAGVRFEIQRGGVAAHNLSDGECSLIAFCYFVARLQDDNSDGKDLIVYIDDPISSLDGNHIFFVYGLIEGVLAKPVVDDANQKQYRYKQLFISTHNLDFLKFLKRLSKPKNDHDQFMVVMKANGSFIQSMPDYLRNYVTEFHFLFDQLCICCDTTNATSSHHSFYNFGNNLRKFLEVYLFFRFPFSFNDGDGNRRMEMFFDDDPAVEPLVDRLVNELSHLGGAIDRGMQPIDYEEITRMSRYVLKKMKSRDAVQFNELLRAVGKSDPIPTL